MILTTLAVKALIALEPNVSSFHLVKKRMMIVMLENVVDSLDAIMMNLVLISNALIPKDASKDKDFVIEKRGYAVKDSAIKSIAGHLAWKKALNAAKIMNVVLECIVKIKLARKDHACL